MSLIVLNGTEFVSGRFIVRKVERAGTPQNEIIYRGANENEANEILNKLKSQKSIANDTKTN